MVYIITKKTLGKTRSEQEKNLRKEGWGKSLTDEQLSKCKYLEKKTGMKYGVLSQPVINKVGRNKK